MASRFAPGILLAVALGLIFSTLYLLERLEGNLHDTAPDIPDRLPSKQDVLDVLVTNHNSMISHNAMLVFSHPVSIISYCVLLFSIALIISFLLFKRLSVT
jgi:hypothetical protein